MHKGSSICHSVSDVFAWYLDISVLLRSEIDTSNHSSSEMSTSASSSVSNNGFIDIDIYSKSVTEKGVKKPWRANSITTTKYTLLNWLPKSIWAQFRRIANVYFLVISVLMMIGTYATSLWSTPLSPYSTVSTLVFVLLVTSIKEGYEDLQRAKSDSYENLKNVIVITFTEDGIKHERTIKSQDVCPGDIIKLEGSTAVPVDLLLIYTSLYSDGNKCYIETANLDGETNLKLQRHLRSYWTSSLKQ